MFQVAEFGGAAIEPAGTPQIARRFRIFEERIAALDDSVGHDAMEGAAVVIALAGELDELLDVFRRFVGREFEAERAELGA